MLKRLRSWIIRSWWARCRWRLEFGQKIFRTACSTLGHNSVLRRFGGEVVLSRQPETVLIHNARATAGEKFVAQLFELGGNPHSFGYASIETAFIASELVPDYVLRFT